MDGLSDLAFFALLMREGSLTAAARELGVTTPAVSKRLAQVERRLGVRLLHRTTRRIGLTQEGELYLSRGSGLLAELSELEQQVASNRATPAGLLRVNASFGFGRVHVAPAVSAFVAAYPGMEIQLHLSDRPLALSEHGYDLGIVFGEPPDTHVHARRLVANRRVLCAAPSYLRSRGLPATPQELTRHACLILRENESAYGAWSFTRGRKRVTVKVRGPLSSNDGSTVLAWALDGHGVITRSSWEVDEHLRSGALTPLLTDWSLPPSDIYAVYLERHGFSAKLRAFVEFLQERFAGALGAG